MSQATTNPAHERPTLAREASGPDEPLVSLLVCTVRTGPLYPWRHLLAMPHSSWSLRTVDHTHKHCFFAEITYSSLQLGRWSEAAEDFAAGSVYSPKYMTPALHGELSCLTATLRDHTRSLTISRSAVQAARWKAQVQVRIDLALLSRTTPMIAKVAPSQAHLVAMSLRHICEGLQMCPFS